MGVDAALMGEATPCLCDGAYDQLLVIQFIVFLICHTWLVVSFSGRHTSWDDPNGVVFRTKSCQELIESEKLMYQVYYTGLDFLLLG